jgi:hypothetical protein
MGDRPWERTLLMGVVGPLKYLGRWDEATAIADDVFGAEGFDISLVAAESADLAQIHVFRGELDVAERLLAEAQPDESESVQTRISGAVVHSMILRARGDPEAALAASEATLDLTVKIWDPAIKESHLEVLEARFALGELGAVEEHLALIEGLPPAELSPVLRAQAARFRSRLIVARGGGDAAPGFKAATGMFRELSMPFWLAVTELEHGEWLMAQGRAAEAGPLLSEARAIFERLKARPWLERLDAADTATSAATASVP